MHHVGAGYTLTRENSRIIENKEHGIRADGSTPIIKNSVIAGNGYSDGDFFGIYMYLPTEVPVLHNNTIAYNANAGISWVDDFGGGGDPDVLDYPDIQNCILWYNNDGGGQLAGFGADTSSYYSCIQDCNDVNFNISIEPGFAYEYSDDPNVMLNVHLAYDSPLRDLGNPSLIYDDQLDIDGEERVVGTRADIGADEIYSCDDDLSEDDIYNALDWNADGVLNFKEYRYWSASWLSHDPNDPAINDPNHPDYDDLTDPDSPNYIDPNQIAAWLPKCNLVDTGSSEYAIDLADLMEFRDNGWWLWTACWRESQTYRFGMMAMAMGAGAQSASVMTREPIVMETAAAPPWSPEWFLAKGESEQVSFVMGIYAVLDYIDARIQEKPPNTETLYELQAFLLECLEDIKATREYQSTLNGPKIYNYPE